MDKVSGEIFAIYFSGYTAHMIKYMDVLYPSAEHAYHCQRYIDEKIIEEIKTARSPFKAWEVSQKYKNQQIADFGERKAEVMEEICRAKMQQHEDIQKALLESGDALIVKHISTGPKADGFWDDGADGTGRNEIGRIWMRLREELRSGTTSA